MFYFIKIVEDQIKLYKEPEFDEEGNLIKDSLTEEEKKRKLQISLNNDVLITNCGVPIIFVINKVDSPFPKYEDKAEFILRHIRKNAINYGATVIYTSTKTSCNINVLYDYIFHVLFNLDLVHKSNITDKNSYFIPSGYDRLSVLKSNDTQNDLNHDYADQIKGEKEEDIVMEEEIKCEKLSDYLKKIKERVYRSRKSLIRNDIKLGKSLAGLGDSIRKSIEVPKEQAEEKNANAGGEKVNKFQKFMEKRDSKVTTGEADASGKDEKLSKEERALKARESLLNKLRLSKKK